MEALSSTQRNAEMAPKVSVKITYDKKEKELLWKERSRPKREEEEEEEKGK